MNGKTPFRAQPVARTRPRQPPWRSQTGLTLIELLVALLLSGFVAIAAVSSLIVARRGFSTVDAASQLRDNGRFATELIQRVVTQAGYLDVNNAVNVRGDPVSVAGAAAQVPYTIGFNNALVSTTSPLTAAPLATDTSLNGSRATGCASTDTACANGSDMLVLRYQTPAITPGSTVGDRSTINCAGQSQDTASTQLTDMSVSAFHVQVNNGEPTLMCSTQSSTGTWIATPVPLVQGVESFQVLFGVDGVTPGASTPATTTRSFIANRYLRADQIVVSGNPVETANNWRRVRSVRIGMVLRGPVNSTQDTGTMTFNPLGQAMGLAADSGSIFVAPADRRLRQSVTFTAYMRNDQGL